MSSELPCCKLIVLLAFFVLTASTASATNAAPGDTLAAVRAAESTKSLLLRSEVVRQAKAYLGLRYRYAGKQPETGFDCSGFTSYVMGLFSVPLSCSSRGQATEGLAVDVEAVRPGDLVVFRRSRHRAVSHVALVVENSDEGLFVIHSTSRGVVIDNLYESSYWKPKIFAARDVLSEALDRAEFPPADTGKPAPPDVELIDQLIAQAHFLLRAQG
jgi:cell wall-associated NlpC family hydrolase